MEFFINIISDRGTLFFRVLLYLFQLKTKLIVNINDPTFFYFNLMIKTLREDRLINL